MKSPYERRVDESVEFLKGWSKSAGAPDVCVVLGSGLSGLVDSSQLSQSISFNDIPGFKTTAVKGHSGSLSLLNHNSLCVAILSGRVHGYEGYDAGEVAHNIRTLLRWGTSKAILTNASGCVEPQWKVGEVMLIADQINATGTSPLEGDFGLGFGKRFVDMSEPFDRGLQQVAREVFAKHGHALREGVYYGLMGPAYETPAEVRMIRNMGASAVGMSTVLEALAARQLNAKVLGLSCLTNFAAGLLDQPLSHEEVVEAGKGFQKIFQGLFLELCAAVCAA